MPLTPNSRVYEQKLERTRKKYESRNAFATERSRKAREESFSSPAPKPFRGGGHPGLNYAPGSGTNMMNSLSERLLRNYTTDVGDATSRTIQDTFMGGKGKSNLLDYSLATPNTGNSFLDAAIKYNPTNLLAGNLLNNSDFSQMLAPGDIIPVEKAASLGLKAVNNPLVRAGARGAYRGFADSLGRAAYSGITPINSDIFSGVIRGAANEVEKTKSAKAIETVTGLFDEELDPTKLKEMASRVNSGDYGLVGGRFGGVDEAITRLYGEPALLPQYSSTGAIQGIKRRLESPAIIRFGETLDTSKNVLNGVEKQVTRTLSESAKRTSRAAAKELFGVDSKVKEDLVATLLGLKNLGFMEGVSPTGLKDMIEATVHDAPGLARGAGLLQETASKQLGVALQYSSDPQQALVEYLTRLSMSGRLGSAFKNSSLQVDHFGRYGSPSTTGQWAAKEATKYLPKDLFSGDKLVPGYLRDWLDAGNSLPSEVTTGIGDVVRHQSSEKNVSGISEPVNLNWGALPRELGYLMDPTIIRNIGRDSFGFLKPGSKYLKERVPMHTQFWDDFFEKNPLSFGFWEFANNPETLTKADLRRIGRVRGKHN